MRITSKGQVTIPKNIRERLGVGPGSEVDFVERADGAVELVGAGHAENAGRALQRSIDKWLAQVVGTGDSGLTTDEIMAMTRGDPEAERNGDGH